MLSQRNIFVWPAKNILGQQENPLKLFSSIYTSFNSPMMENTCDWLFMKVMLLFLFIMCLNKTVIHFLKR